ncbi:serine/threonine-protein kinase [Streptomyces sp. NPDC052036]|uniref:serine/threonine-protein kinase n=1 Tax=Streptomyces sp. NPDC052036 TaxID=3155171 RepID=UPI003423AD58
MGEVFAGRYELVDPIGRGGVGAVWRAWDHRRRRYVAAKVLQQRDAHALLRFVREQALRIDHPHVLAPASWAADDDKVLFTMDLVAGGSLVHLVGDYGPLPPAFVCTLLDQLLSGLAAVHAEGVVHRDIKPANVLLEATGTARPRLRLSDFGIAMRLGEPRLTETDYVVGTPGYLAPEQLLGSEPDFPSDLFAVGLVALYLLQGAKPDARALVEHFASHGTPGAPRGVPGPLWEVVATLLQPDPAARFRTATGARKALGSARELLPEPGDDDEQVEIFDQLGPLPAGFGPEGPLATASGVSEGAGRMRTSGAAARASSPADGVSGPALDASGGAAGGAGASGSGASGAGASGAGASGVAWTASAGAGPRPSHGGSAGAEGGPARLTTGAIPPRPTTAPTASGTPVAAPAAPPAPPPPGHGTGTSAVVPGPPPPAVRPQAGPDGVPPRPAVDPTPPSRPSTMSDTGSFPLPPPLPRAALSTVPGAPGQPPTPPATVVAPAPAPAYTASTLHHEPTYVPAPGPHTAPAAAAGQTAYAGAVPSPYAPTGPQRVARHGRRAAPRPAGPPAKVAVPVLLLALVCFAVGFWALTRI